jgi:hypothetical protein
MRGKVSPALAYASEASELAHASCRPIGEIVDDVLVDECRMAALDHGPAVDDHRIDRSSRGDGRVCPVSGTGALIELLV